MAQADGGPPAEATGEPPAPGFAPPAQPSAFDAPAAPMAASPSRSSDVTGAPRAGPRDWLPSLQSLRGVAALGVVLYHVDLVLFAYDGPLLQLPGARVGWLGVDLFFVLSAYLLAQPFLDGRSRPVGRFWRDRLLRIAPAYYASWVLTAAFLWVWVPETWDVPWSAWSLAFLNNVHSDALYALNPVFWTLAVEMQFYLVLPLLVRGFTGRRWPWALGACILVATGFRAWSVADGGYEPLIWGTYSLPAFLGHFALGMAAARVRRLPRPGWAALASIPLVVVPTMLLIPDGSLGFGYESLAGQVFVRPLAACGFALLVLAFASPGRLASALSLAPFRWLGDISYSLYLIHIPAEMAVALAMDVVRHPWLYTLAAVAASLAAGALLHAAVEAPAERWRHRGKLRRRVLRRRRGRDAAPAQ